MATLSSEASRLLAEQDPKWLHAASIDVAEAMRRRWGLTLYETHELSARGAGGWCDGMSITTSGLVAYRPTGNRRDRFTLAHELAHTLAENDDDCLNWLSTQDGEMDRRLEQLCDLIASRILIPDHRIVTALAGGPPEGSAVARLYDLSEASWSCCSIALSSRMPCDGFVALVDRRNHQVRFSARARDTHPYAWAGDVVPPGNPLRTVTTPTVLKAWWPRFNIHEPRTYYVSVDIAGDWLRAVFAANDLWGVETLHLPDRERPERYDGEIDCPSCGYKGTTRMFPCSTCGAETCHRCQKCECDRKNELQRGICKICTKSVLPHLLADDDVCVDCR